MTHAQHIPLPILQQFADAGVSTSPHDAPLPERLAVQVALHLDDCPECTATLASLDRNQALFDAMDRVPDIVAPAQLADQILVAYHQPKRAPLYELVVGSTLLTAACLLFWVDGTSFLVDGASAAAAAKTMLRSLLTALQAGGGYLSLGLGMVTVFAAMGVVATARWGSTGQRSHGGGQRGLWADDSSNVGGR